MAEDALAGAPDVAARLAAARMALIQPFYDRALAELSAAWLAAQAAIGAAEAALRRDLG
jgi:hypothetical protein